MKSPLIVAALLLFFLLTLPHTAQSQHSCSCKFADDSCNASIRCSKHGCTAICVSSKACYAACGKDLLVSHVNLKLNNVTSSEIAKALSRHTGRRIEFSPRRRDEKFTIDIRANDVWDTLEYLSERGDLKVNGEPWGEYQRLRRSALGGGKLSIAFDGIRVKNALAHLSFLSGLSYEVTSGDSGKRLSLSLRDITLDEILARISSQTGVVIRETDKRP